MAPLSLSLFGAVQATLAGQVVESFRTTKVQALLIYIAIEAGAHSREKLIDLLWPGMPERSARHNLRQTLYHLRTIIPDPVVEVSANEDEEETIPLVVANRLTIELNPAAGVQVDVHRFQQLVERTLAHEHPDLLICSTCQQDLEEAAALYVDDFLADFYLDDSNQFEEWAQVQRELYRRENLDVLGTLTTIFSRRKEYAQAINYAQRQLEIDNLRESAYRQLMEVLALSGRREEALSTYEKCRRLLAEELAMAPSKRTTELHDKILAGDLSFDTPPEPGVRGYELKDEIGEGAYGSIRRAVQPAIGREVAVKVIRRRYASDPEFIRRFEAEAQTVARLEHPHIVPLYDYWRDPDGAYLVMRYLRGGSLLSALQAGPWDILKTASMLDQVAAALATAHRQGVVHRDIKPANILLDEPGNAYLSDFGIAKDLTGQMQLTAEGAVIGTPDYISPEQILSQDISPQTDIYSLGAVIYETLTGEKPFPDTSVANLIYKHLNDPVPQVATTQPGIPPQVDAVIQRATAKNPADRYADALEMAKAFRQAVSGGIASISVQTSEVSIPTIEVYNPYKGLRAFQEADADDFFGREALAQRLVGRLADSRFMALVGPSGSGKSSAVKAGLIPALRAGAIPGSEKWFVAEMAPGSHPLEELEMALWPIAVDPPPSLVEPMQRDNRGLLRTLRRILPDEPNAQLLLVVDQFEELFTQVEDEARRVFFMDSLLQAIHAPRSPLTVVITLRADFYDRPLHYETLGKLLKENTEVILPLNSEELTWAIREPARRVGVRLEEGLAGAIVADLADQPGSLPMLQYALTELFERRQSGIMTLAAYRTIGGVLGALGRRAEEIYADLDEPGREAARQLFLRLVTLGEGAEDTRRRVLRSELEAIEGQSSTSKNQQQIIDQFGAARLFSFDHDPVARQPTVEVAHEALLREWKRLRSWLDQSRADVRLQRLLAAAAAEWRAAGQDPGFLLRDARLDQFVGWAETATIALTGDEQAYLQTSLAAREVRLAEEEARLERELETAQKLAETEHARAEEQAQAAGRLRQRALLLAGALAIAAILAIAALFFARQSNQNETAAVAEASQRATAQAQAELERERAEEQRAVAMVESEQRATAQARAEEETAIRATAEAVALRERETAEELSALAEEQAALASSRELAAASLVNLDKDPELSILLAMQALSSTHTVEAEEALHQAILSSRVRQRLQSDPSDGLLTAWVTASPDGQTVFTSGLNGGILWDRQTGEMVHTFTAERFSDYLPADQTEWWINRADFSPDGSLLALPLEAWIDDEPQPGNVMILDAKTGQEVLVFEAFDNSGVQDLTFSHDGAQLAGTGIPGNQAVIWDVPATLAAGSGQELVSFCCHDDWIYSVNYSPDDSQIVTTSADNATKIWDVATGAELLTIADYAAGDAVFSPDGQVVILADDNEIALIEAESGEVRDTVPGPDSSIAEMLLSPDGERLAASSFDGPIWIWNYANGQIDQDPLIVSGHSGQVIGLAFTPDSRFLVSGGVDGSARVWDLSANGASEYGTFAHDDLAVDVAFSPDGSWFASTSKDGTVRNWDIATGEERLRLIEHEYGFGDVAIHPDGGTLATAGDDGFVRLWDAQTGAELLAIQAHEVYPGQRYPGVKVVSYSPDGNRLLTAGADEFARVWDTSTGEELLTLGGHIGRVRAAAYSPDGRWLITTDETGTIRLWDPVDGRELGTLSGDGSRVFEAQFSPDGTRLVTGHESGQAIVWSFPGPEAGQDAWPEKLYEIQHNPGWVGQSAFSPDGNLLAVGGINQASLYDAATGERLLDFGPIGMMAEFSPDGRMIAATGFDGTVRLLAANQQDLLALARSRVTRSLTGEECQRYLHLEACPP